MVANKTLYYHGEVNFSNFEVNLTRGIFIKPQEMYMIHVNIPQRMVGKFEAA